MYEDGNRPERPRAEPEIIPPNRTGQQDWSNRRDHVFTHSRGSQRVYVGRLGPFTVVLLMLALAAMVAIILIVALGAVLIWLPIVVLLVVGGALARVLRR
jgi:hypothetical protein